MVCVLAMVAVDDKWCKYAKVLSRWKIINNCVDIASTHWASLLFVQTFPLMVWNSPFWHSLSSVFATIAFYTTNDADSLKANAGDTKKLKLPWYHKYSLSMLAVHEDLSIDGVKFPLFDCLCLFKNCCWWHEWCRFAKHKWGNMVKIWNHIDITHTYWTCLLFVQTYPLIMQSPPLWWSFSLQL